MVASEAELSREWKAILNELIAAGPCQGWSREDIDDLRGRATRAIVALNRTGCKQPLREQALLECRGLSLLPNPASPAQAPILVLGATLPPSADEVPQVRVLRCCPALEKVVKDSKLRVRWRIRTTDQHVAFRRPCAPLTALAYALALALELGVSVNVTGYGSR